jgi:hypothetical protein
MSVPSLPGSPGTSRLVFENAFIKPSIVVKAEEDLDEKEVGTFSCYFI